MKKNLLIFSSITILMTAFIGYQQKHKLSVRSSSKKEAKNTLRKNVNNQLPFPEPIAGANADHSGGREELEKQMAFKEYENSPLIYKYEYDLQKNPITGKIPGGITEASYAQAKSLPSRENSFSRTTNLNTYAPAGPDNLGGRTRSFAYDVRFAANKVIIAGSTSSGVMRTADGGTTWALVVGTNNIHDISCVAQDTRAGHQDTWYMGTGEYEGSTAVGGQRPGYGVYKSNDNGLSWTRLVNSNTGVYENADDQKDFITRLVVNPVNGDVLIAGVAGIFRSADGGTSWALVIGPTSLSTIDPADVTDIVCTSGGVYYAAFAGTTNIGTSFDGIWKSSTGLSGSWTRISGNGTPAGWKTVGGYQRIVLALAPSNQNILYALYNNIGSTTADCDFFEYDAAGAGSWTANRAANLPREGGGQGNFDTQGGYDIVVAVKPDDQNFVIIAGTSAYTSSNGFATPSSFKRIGGYTGDAFNTTYPNHHPDIHTFTFEPGSNIKMLCGDDGGIQVTNDVTVPSVVWIPLNNSYQTYQYNYVAMDPTAGSTKYIGGSQDNGTTYRNNNTNSMVSIYSGDGASVGISAGNVYHYVSSQEGDIQRETSAGGVASATDIKPSSLGAAKGIFYTLFYLDVDNTEILYYANSRKLFRTAIASTVSPTAGWVNMTGISTAAGSNLRALATTRGNYDTRNCLFIGTESGKIFRLQDPLNASAGTVPDDITPSGITAGSTVINIATAPGSRDTVLAVVSNFGVPSIFWTGNATAASPVWYIVEGTGAGKLDLPSFRSCAIVKKGNIYEYYAGTAVGLFSTTNIDGASQATANNTSWVREGTGVIDQAIVASLVLRTNDNTLLIGSHGNGMYVTNIGTGSPSLITDYFRTKQSGNWNDINTWESSTDNISWQPATLTPDFNANTITVRSSHTVTITASVTTDQTVINAGGVIIVNNGNSLVINDGAGFDIAVNGTLTVQSGATMVLKSAATGTASLGNSTGTITGNVTVERYISDKRSWRLLGIPFNSTAQTIQSSWMEGATSASNNPNAPYGTHITTFTGDANAVNYDAVKPASSIRTYSGNNFSSDASHTPNTTNLITSNPAYFLFVRGNRSIDLNNTTAHSSATIRATGTVTSGNTTRGVSGTNFSLIANPYASPLDFDSLKSIAANSGISTFYVWDASLGTVGQYRTISITGSSAPYTYTATPGSVSNTWRFIESGVAFMVPGSTQISFTENSKTPSLPPSSMLRTVNTEIQFAINLNIINADNTISVADGVREIFDNAYSNAIDKNDAKKIDGFNENFGINNNNIMLSVERRPLPIASDVVSLKLWNASPGNYQLEIQPENIPSQLPPAYVYDNYLNTYTPVIYSNTTTLNFNLSSDAASSATNRFSIVFSKPKPEISSIVVYPNPVQHGVVKLQLNNMPKGSYTATLFNDIGQIILIRQLNHAEGTSTESIEVGNLKGAYLIEVKKPDNTKSVNKLIIK